MTQFIWLGGRPSLDLCNTLTPVGDLLDTPEDVAEWLTQGGFARPDDPCKRDLKRVRTLRDSLRTAFIDHDVAQVAQVVSVWLNAAPGRLAVDPVSMETSFCTNVTTCECVFVPVVLDAIDLARGGLDRIRVCASEKCGMLYLDVSRNRSRRWCSMDRCGSRAKAHAYYVRKRSGVTTQDREHSQTSLGAG